ncbi:Nramp family divalent metal transporter [Plantactinospora sp. S1510]|uniref:Nramp family divalent metal transporter n=1 Tax=Plantactinospora alkalitolerans TaxID=2789879 RepID=A0ABS0H3W9_9ACTN|nr:Nramp family divalent metal transporter [Plantactinospora alkalitolerans]MBF9133151.1 Nramp family divalent metal transporter [Plantactinospora alkalitolerans]
MSQPATRPGTTVPPGGIVTQDLPEPMSLRRMVGPGVVAVGIGLAAGEIVLWPYLTAIGGLGLLWLAFATLAVQFVINMEIERYTLATGQTAVAGFSRWWKGWGIIICLAGAFQYVWPGWATGGSTVFTYLVGGGNAVWITVAVLVVIGVLLSISKVIYRTVERVEIVKVALTLFFLAVVVVFVISAASWGEGARETVVGFGQIPEGITFTLLLSAIGAAGAGGVHNLVLSNWIRDKRYGMGAHVPRLISPITGQEEASGADRYAFPQDDRNLDRWQTWWKRANIEHLLAFLLVCFVTITIMSLLAYDTLFGRDDLKSDTSFLRIEGDVLAAEVGTWLKLLFFAIAAVSLWAAAMGLLDVIGRVASDFLRRNYLATSTRWTEARLYLAVVWGEIVLGSVILLAGFTQPIGLLLVSTCAASVVTLLYSVLLVRLNVRDLPAAIRMRGWRLGGMLVAIGFYGFFAIAMVVTQIQKL